MIGGYLGAASQPWLGGKWTGSVALEMRGAAGHVGIDNPAFGSVDNVVTTEKPLRQRAGTLPEGIISTAFWCHFEVITRDALLLSHR